MTRTEILDLAREAGWDLCLTRSTNEREFGGSVPLEIEQIKRFVDLLEVRIRGEVSSSE
jgi:hypothetical protein